MKNVLKKILMGEVFWISRQRSYIYRHAAMPSRPFSLLSSPFSAPRRQAGFSLIEVVMALAILGSGIILILGMMPNSIQTGQNATAEPVGGMIAETILNQAVADIKDTNGGMVWGAAIAYVHYFDKDGKDLGTSPSVAGVKYRGTVRPFCPCTTTNGTISSDGLCGSILPVYRTTNLGVELIKAQATWPVIDTTNGYVPCVDSNNVTSACDPEASTNLKPKNRVSVKKEVANPNFGSY